MLILNKTLMLIETGSSFVADFINYTEIVMNKLIAKIAEDKNWAVWMTLNSMASAGCISGEKKGCISVTRGCISITGKSGCIS